LAWVIPATLCLLALLTCAGPWGAYHVSLASQRHRLERLLARHGLRVVTTAATARVVPFADRKEIAATLRYLVERHDRQGIAARFGGPASLASAAVETRVRPIMTSIGVPYVSRWEGEQSKVVAYRGARGRRDEVPISLLRAEASGWRGAALLYLTALNAVRGDSGWAVTSLDGELFLRLQ
jgi:hypothetical protein